MPTTPSPALETLPIKALHARYQAAFGTATASRNRPWLIARLRAAGDQPTALPPTEPAAAAVPTTADAPVSAAVTALGLPLGSILRKTYKGRELELTIRADGFALDGTVYRSLSAAATAVAGSNWNGHVFFGLKKRGGAA